jgi:tryptophanyl-tRNA synthetase
MRQWVRNQDQYDNFFCVVDMHAITAPHDAKKLSEDSLSMAALYLAAGIDVTKNSKVFIQSHVRAHAELAWILNCVTPMGWLERMIQYKEKAIRQGESTGLGLFAYPVLMAADILLYQAEFVPVGEDQRQHLELTRDIARRFNDQFCTKKSKMRPVFREPTALIVKEGGARVMSLLDGTCKMSKSAESDFSRINLLDPPDVIVGKIKRCRTDPHAGLEFDNPARPECANLLSIYVAVSGKSREEVAQETAAMTWGAFKPLLADALVAHMHPMQKRYTELMADREHLETVLAEGAEAASAVAERTLGLAKAAVGFHVPQRTKRTAHS